MKNTLALFFILLACVACGSGSDRNPASNEAVAKDSCLGLTGEEIGQYVGRKIIRQTKEVTLRGGKIVACKFHFGPKEKDEILVAMAQVEVPPANVGTPSIRCESIGQGSASITGCELVTEQGLSIIVSGWGDALNLTAAEHIIDLLRTRPNNSFKRTAASKNE